MPLSFGRDQHKCILACIKLICAYNPHFFIHAFLVRNCIHSSLLVSHTCEVECHHQEAD